MVDLTILLIIFWLPSTLVIWKNILWDLYLWQVKEYRFDRMLSQLLSQEEDLKQSTIVYVSKIISFIIVVLYLFYPDSNILLIGIALTFLIFTFESLITIEKIIGRRLIRPKISFRNILILGLSLVMIVSPFIIVLYPSLLVQKELLITPETSEQSTEILNFLPFTIENTTIKVFPAATLALLFSTLFALVLDLSTPIYISFFVFLTEPFAQIRRRKLMSDAKKKISSLENLKVVGITGSYGKTTTKEMLYQILKEEFNVVKTPKNYNSAVGVAIAVNTLLNRKTEVFIAEMGAYTVNEVKDATDIVKPDISIVTGIDSQHISLFGSQENIMKAKFEIIEHAKKDAVAILNGDNPYTLRMADMTIKDKVVYFTSNGDGKIVSSSEMFRKNNIKINKNSALFAYDISKKGDLELKFNYKDKTYSLKTNIKGKHNAQNLLAAIGACLKLGMKPERIVDIIEKIKFKLPYLNRTSGLNRTIIIDDGYNSSTTGFLSALDELATERGGKRIVITKGIIELGNEKASDYLKIAKKLQKTAHILITSDKHLIRVVKENIPGFVCIKASDPFSFVKEYNRVTEEGDVVLIEGAMPKLFLNEVIDKD